MEGWGLIKGAYEACDDVPGMGASIDYLIEPGPKELEMGWTGTGVLQVKYSLGATHRLRWTDGEPPLYVLYQLQHEMRCKGASWGAVGCLVDGALKVYRSKAHDATQANIVGMVREFWRALEPDTPIFAPNGRRVDIVDGSASTSDTIAAMWPVPPLEDLLDLTGDNEAADIAFDVLTYRASRMQAEKAEDEAMNRLKAKMEGHKNADVQGFKIRGTYVADNPGRDPKPGEKIGVRKGYLRYTVKEDMGQ